LPTTAAVAGPAPAPASAGAGGAAAVGGETYSGTIAAAAAQYGVPQPILYHLLGAESSFNPNAGPSSAGARGIAPFIPSTAAKYGVDVTNPDSSITGAAHYLADL
jgi:soluble lytic murein transglycosylase-like protein